MVLIACHAFRQCQCSNPWLCCVAVAQDTVPRGGKLISAYKRSGQRVVINKIGDIVVSCKLKLEVPTDGSYTNQLSRAIKAGARVLYCWPWWALGSLTVPQQGLGACA